jgi:uncharacterized OB-fold protein
MSEPSTAPRFIDDSLVEGLPDDPVLVGSRCRSCGTVAFPMQSSCPKCTSLDVERHPLPRRGTLWSFTTQRFAPKTPYLAAAGPFRPFGVGYVELGGEVRVESRLVADDLESLCIDMPMELTLEAFHDEGGQAVLTFAFQPARQT